MCRPPRGRGPGVRRNILCYGRERKGVSGYQSLNLRSPLSTLCVESLSASRLHVARVCGVRPIMSRYNAVLLRTPLFESVRENPFLLARIRRLAFSGVRARAWGLFRAVAARLLGSGSIGKKQRRGDKSCGLDRTRCRPAERERARSRTPTRLLFFKWFSRQIDDADS